MSSLSSCSENWDEVSLTATEVLIGQNLISWSSAYTVLDILGEGCFGKVAKCHNLLTKQTVAIKILKQKASAQEIKNEVNMLKAVGKLDPDQVNVVKFLEQFDYMGQTCLVFEMLDRNLYRAAMKQGKPLSLREIRPIAKQLMVSLDALKVLGILHTDIKPDNVMFVNMQDQPLRIKLIDFGLAIPTSQIRLGGKFQAVGYRAPEVALGLPLSEAIDAWGVGCVLAFLYLAQNLFYVRCEYQMMNTMVKVLGLPEDHLLHAGIYTQHFFVEEAAAGPTWRLMTPTEYKAANRKEPKELDSIDKWPSSLDDLVNVYPKEDADEFDDRTAFIDLIKGLLHWDGEERISPSNALLHPFITASHLSCHPDTADCIANSQTMMSVCPDKSSAVRVKSRAASVREDDASAPLFCGTPTSHLERPAVPFTHRSDKVSLGQNPLSCSSATMSVCPDESSAVRVKSRAASVSELWSGSTHSVHEDDVSAPVFCGTPTLHLERPVACTSTRAKMEHFTTAASVSSVHTPKLLKRIRRFFRRITAACCCSCRCVED